jgi:hypothetical protein
MTCVLNRLDDGPTGLETWEIILDYATDSVFGAVGRPGSIVLANVHPGELCAGRPCPIHNQTDHHMRDWPLLWRDDRGIFERVCPHGVGHPDPDQLDYWRETGQDAQAIHGCEGCCEPRLVDAVIPDDFGPED